MMVQRIVVLVVLMSFMVCGVAFGTDRFVSADGTGEYATIEDAVDACYADDRVVLMPGVYTGPGNRDVEIQDDIVIMAYNFQQDTVVIDCQGSAANPWQAFVVVDGNPTFKYLTITGGYATNGGAIELQRNASIYKCKFVGNIAERGGAISAVDTEGLALDYCLFANNRATIEGGAVYLFGNFSATLYKSTFVRNYSDSGSSLFISGNANLAMTQSILVLGRGSVAVGDYYAGSITATYSDIWGNAGGDWTDQLASQLGTNDNIKADPLFCDPDAPLPNYKVSLNSPAIFVLGAAMGSAGFDDTWAVPVYGVSADGSGMFPTIQAALDTVPVPGEVVLYAGTYSGPGSASLTFHGKDVTLRSRDLNAATTIITASGQRDRVIWLRDGETTAATISYLTIKGGDADFSSDYPGYGGGILLTGAEVTLRGCVIQFNQGANCAGVSLNNEINSLVIEDCEIARNGDLNLYFQGNRLDLTGTLFWNYAGRSDVGIWTGGLANDVNVENCEFINFEKAVHIDHPVSSATFDFVGNTFSEGESAMTIEGAGNVLLDGNTFTRRRNNGALTIVDSHVIILSCDFDGCNRVLGGGGAVNADNSRIFMERCNLTSNYSSQNGGAIYAINGNLNLNLSKFTNNWCIIDELSPLGGAVFVSGGSLGLYASLFDNNRAYLGAAVYCENIYFNSLDAEFVGNHGTGQGILNVNHGVTIAEITETTFVDNIVDHGSAIFVNADSVTVEGSTIAGNSGSTGFAQIEFFGFDDLVFDRNIVAFGLGVAAMYVPAVHGTWDLACNDIYDNDSGDYVGSVAVWQSVAGNISEDPYFCDPNVYAYTLQLLSPCLAANNTCGVDIGAFGHGCPQVSAAPDDVLPRAFTLAGNIPNPFNPRTEIRFSLPAASAVELDIYDVQGRKVCSPLTGQKYVAGTHKITWEGKDYAGRAVPSGTYLYSVIAGGRTLTGKMVLLR